MIRRDDGATAADVIDPDWSSKANVIVTNRLYGVSSLYTTYPTNGYYTSGIFDTHHPSPQYARIDWDADTPLDSALGMRVRSSTNSDMSGAAPWDSITPMTTPGTITPSMFSSRLF
ncbi:hypothetical protein ACFLSJ_08560 [Verrucomicrobiota bacterium]